jgi:hypothetical protein
MVNDYKLNLIGILRDYCNREHLYFIPGPDAYRNAIMDQSIYAANDLILVCDLQFSPVFGENSLNDVQYNGTIALGRKREIASVATLDETFEQKYDRRLMELSNLLTELLLSLQCEHNFVIDSAQMSYALNEYDLNADFVSAEIQMTI